MLDVLTIELYLLSKPGTPNVNIGMNNAMSGSYNRNRMQIYANKRYLGKIFVYRRNTFSYASRGEPSLTYITPQYVKPSLPSIERM